ENRRAERCRGCAPMRDDRVRRQGQRASRIEDAVAVNREWEAAVKTDKLIDMLSTNLEPVDHRHPSRALIGAVAIAVSTALALMLMALGIRHDLTNVPALLSFGLKVLFAGVILGLAVVSLSKVIRPGGEGTVSLTLISLPFIAITLLALAMLAMSPSSHWRTMLLGNQWLECLLSIPLIAIVPFALITWVVRQP